LATILAVPGNTCISPNALAPETAFGLKALFMRRDAALIRLLVPAGLLGTVVGTLSFGLLAPKVVAGIVGALTLLFLAQRLLFPPSADAPAPPRWLGFGLGVASGFTSFIAHAGSPPISAYVLPLRLAPITFTATMATFFAVINLSKWVPYAWLGLIEWRNITTSLVLMPLAPLGVWLGIRLVPLVGPVLFYRLVYVGMFLTGTKLLWDGVH